MNRIFLVALAACAVSVANGARAEPVIAKLRGPLQGAGKPIAGGAVFECLGDVCAARAPTADTPSLRGCRELARQVGGLLAYGPSSKQLTPDEVAECSKSAR